MPVTPATAPFPAPPAHWHVLGAGAQGLLLYALARRQAQPWTLLLREGSVAAATLSYECAQSTEQLVVHAQTLAAADQLKNVVVCVKTYQLQAALQALTPRLASDALVLLALNGYGWLDAASAQLAGALVLPLCSTRGSFRRGPFHVVDAGVAGEFHVGPGLREPSTERRAAMQQQWQTAGINLQWDAAIQSRLLRKLAVNACINPLTALHDSRNGELPALPAARHQLETLYAEVCSVLPGMGLPMTVAELRQAVAGVCAATAANYSSMHQDWHGGRITEVDAILGVLLRAAAAQAKELPLLQQLQRQLSAPPACKPAPAQP